jgi:hypothetical protein
VGRPALKWSLLSSTRLSARYIKHESKSARRKSGPSAFENESSAPSACEATCHHSRLAPAYAPGIVVRGADHGAVESCAGRLCIEDPRPRDRLAENCPLDASVGQVRIFEVAAREAAIVEWSAEEVVQELRSLLRMRVPSPLYS